MRKELTPEERFPELILPFVKYLGGPPGTWQCDHWAPPPTAEGTELANTLDLDQGFQGALYALLTIRWMATHPHDYPILSHIMRSMIDKGKFDNVEMGFVDALAAILMPAYHTGIVGQWALNSATHLEKHGLGSAEGFSGLSKELQASLKRAISARREFAQGVQPLAILPISS